MAAPDGSVTAPSIVPALPGDCAETETASAQVTIHQVTAHRCAGPPDTARPVIHAPLLAHTAAGVIVRESHTAHRPDTGIRHHGRVLAELKTEMALGIGPGFWTRIATTDALDHHGFRRHK